MPEHSRTSTKSELQIANAIPEFDVIRELTENRDSYPESKENHGFKLDTFPSSFQRCLRFIQAKASTHTEAATYTQFQLIVACCATYGLKALSANQDAQALITIGKQLCGPNVSDNIYLLEETKRWFNSFEFYLPENIYSKAKTPKRGKLIRKHFSSRLSKDIQALAHGLGMEFETLTPLAVVVALSTQPVLGSHLHTELRQIVKSFLGHVHARTQMAEAHYALLKSTAEFE